jgi:peroxiredoxin
MAKAGMCLSFFAVFIVATTVVNAQQNKVAKDPQETTPLKAGAEVPQVVFHDAEGQAVTLASLHAQRPIVLIFFRGGWCPICTRHTQEIIKAYPEIQDLGYEVIGVSPDSSESTEANQKTNTVPFPLLSDADVSASQAFGLAFQVDDKTIERYRGFGIDLQKASGHDHRTLPIPAIYVIDQSGKILFAHSDPDYRRRLEPKLLLEELTKLKK